MNRSEKIAEKPVPVSHSGAGLASRIGTISDKIAYVTGYLAGWVLMVMMILILTEVVTRYIMRQPLIISDEMSAYMFVFISLVGAAYTMSTKGHIRIDFAVNMLRHHTKSRLRIITLLIFLAYSCVVTVVSYQFVIQSFERGMRSGSWVMTPLWLPQLSIPVGFTLLTLTLIAEIVCSIAVVKSGGNIDVFGEGGGGF